MKKRVKSGRTSDSFICLLCPLGCELKVLHDESRILHVRGNRCKRGLEYAEAEVFHPTRSVTTTVLVRGGNVKLLPVKTRTPVPKQLMGEVVRAANAVVLKAPVRMGQVVVPDVCDSGVDLVASRDVDEVKESDHES